MEYTFAGANKGWMDKSENETIWNETCTCRRGPFSLIDQYCPLWPPAPNCNPALYPFIHSCAHPLTVCVHHTVLSYQINPSTKCGGSGGERDAYQVRFTRQPSSVLPLTLPTYYTLLLTTAWSPTGGHQSVNCIDQRNTFLSPEWKH